MILDYVETHLVEHCNLNCKGCGHFSSIADPHFTDFAVFERDFIRLGELFENVTTVRLLGGEPLLHPEVLRFAGCVRRIFPRAKINLVTNGILLPQQPDHFWQGCAATDLTVQLIRYPLRLDVEQIVQTAGRFGARLEMSREITSFMQFMNFAGDSDPAVSFRNCQARFKCPFVQDGKIFLCALPPSVYIFNEEFHVNIPVSDEDWISIFGDTQPADILEFLRRPSRMCRWCLPEWPRFEWRVGSKGIEDWGGVAADPRLPVLQ